MVEYCIPLPVCVTLLKNVRCMIPCTSVIRAGGMVGRRPGKTVFVRNIPGNPPNRGDKGH